MYLPDSWMKGVIMVATWRDLQGSNHDCGIDSPCNFIRRRQASWLEDKFLARGSKNRDAKRPRRKKKKKKIAGSMQMEERKKWGNAFCQLGIQSRWSVALNASIVLLTLFVKETAFHSGRTMRGADIPAQVSAAWKSQASSALDICPCSYCKTLLLAGKLLYIHQCC